MITKEQFTDLELGDVIETVPLFPALSNDPIQLELDLITGDRKSFQVTWCEINIGRWEASLSKTTGAVIWTT